MYGLDNVGNIKANGDKLYYLKDHLGTVRAVLDTTNTVVAAYDYDPWGYPLSNRTYEASTSVDQKYKFTSKQRDKESGIDGKNGYDYFGARYYDSRVANWTSADPLFEKHFDYSPYNYVLRNPIILIDPDGNQKKPFWSNPVDPPELGRGFGGYKGGSIDVFRILETQITEFFYGATRQGTSQQSFDKVPEIKWQMKQGKGSTQEMGLEGIFKLQNVEVNKQSIKTVTGFIEGFMKNTGAKPELIPNTKLLGIGGIRLYGKQVRIGPDKAPENFFHIDFVQGVKGNSEVKDQIKLWTIPNMFR
ncbi:MAG: hypothetical protein K8I03_00200 [Ignavibacteria bacterium]|nr:hypothetical protein [Ignavibacteria bacterium]